MRNLIFILCTVFLFGISCNNKKSKTKTDFVILNSTIQKIAGGAPGSGISTHYIVNLKMESDLQPEFKYLWINKEEGLKLNRKFKSLEEKNNPLSVGQEFQVRAVKRKMNKRIMQIPSDENPSGDEEKVNPPEFEDEALIEYLINGERKYKAVQSFTALEDLYMP